MTATVVRPWARVHICRRAQKRDLWINSSANVQRHPNAPADVLVLTSEQRKLAHACTLTKRAK